MKNINEKKINTLNNILLTNEDLDMPIKMKNIENISKNSNNISLATSYLSNYSFCINNNYLNNIFSKISNSKRIYNKNSSVKNNYTNNKYEKENNLKDSIAKKKNNISIYKGYNHTQTENKGNENKFKKINITQTKINSLPKKYSILNTSPSIIQNNNINFISFSEYNTANARKEKLNQYIKQIQIDKKQIESENKNNFHVFNSFTNTNSIKKNKNNINIYTNNFILTSKRKNNLICYNSTENLKIKNNNENIINNNSIIKKIRTINLQNFLKLKLDNKCKNNTQILNDKNISQKYQNKYIILIQSNLRRYIQRKKINKLFFYKNSITIFSKIINIILSKFKKEIFNSVKIYSTVVNKNINARVKSGRLLEFEKNIQFDIQSNYIDKFHIMKNKNLYLIKLLYRKEYQLKATLKKYFYKFYKNSQKNSFKIKIKLLSLFYKKENKDQKILYKYFYRFYHLSKINVNCNNIYSKQEDITILKKVAIEAKGKNLLKIIENKNKIKLSKYFNKFKYIHNDIKNNDTQILNINKLMMLSKLVTKIYLKNKFKYFLYLWSAKTKFFNIKDVLKAKKKKKKKNKKQVSSHNKNKSDEIINKNYDINKYNSFIPIKTTNNEENKKQGIILLNYVLCKILYNRKYIIKINYLNFFQKNICENNKYINSKIEIDNEIIQEEDNNINEDEEDSGDSFGLSKEDN